MKLHKYIFLLSTIVMLPLSSFADGNFCNVYIKIKSSVYNDADRVVFEMVNTKKDQEYRNIAFDGQSRISLGEVTCGGNYNIYVTPLPSPRHEAPKKHQKLEYVNNPVALNHDIDISYPSSFKTLE
ncbi:hypothetical protein [Francisella uliginis]|uniref:Spore coat protein U domain-containing protein n=1 Tax=Francisella uliginis TaxID=573570 RepID=A0A1L4BTR7_9GAMM|nr:hypothetical protein [Francisella uliginis]API87225.1 hypothetical protein F7310_07550 [Francisella uliginis]